MTAAALATAPARRSPIQSVLASFLPPQRRHQRSPYWMRHLPLLTVLVLQAVLSLRLSNSPHIDEALYLVTGYGQLTGDPAFTDPSGFFSGSPQLYPLVAASVDAVTGLWGVRLLSCLCMLGATVAVWSLTRSLFGGRHERRVALLSSALFAFSAPVLFLGNFATFDAPSFCLMAWAAALTVASARRDRSAWWMVLAGALLALGVLVKYSSAIDAPIVVLLALLGWSPGRRVRSLGIAGVVGSVALCLLVISVSTWATTNLSGLVRTTLQRTVDSPRTALSLVAEVGSWTGVVLAIGLLGGIVLFRRAPLVAGLLLLGSTAAMVVQIRSGEWVSLHKHVTLGLIFAAPLGGWFLHRLGQGDRRRPMAAAGAAVLLWIATVQGVHQSSALFAAWPDTTVLSATIEPVLDAAPTTRLLGDAPEPLRYSSMHSTSADQWTATWQGSFFYEGLDGVAAYETALRDHHFGVVFLDTSRVATPDEPCGAFCVAEALIPRMESFGYARTAVLRNAAGQEWTVWQVAVR